MKPRTTAAPTPHLRTTPSPAVPTRKLRAPTRTQGAGRDARWIVPSGRDPTLFSAPHANGNLGAIATGPDGNLWFIENPSTLATITTAGVITEIPVTPNSIPGSGICAGPDGNVWFTERSANQIARLTLEGVLTEFPVPTANAYPSQIVSGSDGNLWFSEGGVQQLGRITPAGVVTECPTRPSGGSADVQGLALGPDGNLWFAEENTNEVGRMTISGVVTHFGMPTSNAQAAYIASSASALWMPETFANKVARVTP